MIQQKVNCIECTTHKCFIKKAADIINNSTDQKIISNHRKNQNIILEGDVTEGIYFIKEGSAKVISTGIKNRTQIVRFTTPGDILGHRGLGSKKYPIGVIAIEDSVVCFFSNEVFKSILLESPELAYDLIHYYSLELRASEAKIKKMAQMNVTEKVADALLYLKTTYGKVDENGVILNIDLSRQDISDLVGINTVQLSRILSDFKADNIIELEKNQITIKDTLYLHKLVSVFN